MNKYHAKKTTINGQHFDSKKEAARFAQLDKMQQAGLISQLQTQVVYELIPAQYAPATIGARGAMHKGKLLERAVTYRADFVYINATGETVVEDVKSAMTKHKPEYVIKRKLMLYKHGIKISEV